MNDVHFDMERLRECYQCCRCTSGCDINRLDVTFQPHRLLYLISRGQIEKLLRGPDIWKCTTCFTCTERCPQGVKVTEILWLARSLATKAGLIPELLSKQRNALTGTGRVYPFSTSESIRREKLGLPVMAESSVVARILEEASKEG